MERANKIKLGAFVLLSGVLLISGFLAVGITRVFEPKVRAVTVVNTSVEGLAPGSQVKYLGLSIGKVTRIAMRESDGCIAVYFELTASAMDLMSDRRGNTVGSADELAEILKRRGATCFVNASSLMGGCFLELTLDSPTPPALPHLEDLPEGRLYIPALPSHIGNAIQNISRVIEELNQVNLIMLSDKLERALDRMNDLFGQSDLIDTMHQLNQVSRELSTAVGNLHRALSDENIGRINQSVANIESATDNVRRLTGGAEVAETLKNLNEGITEMRQFLRSAERAGEAFGQEAENGFARIAETLTRLDNLSRSLAAAVDRWEDNPNQVIRGRHDENR